MTFATELTPFIFETEFDTMLPTLLDSMSLAKQQRRIDQHNDANDKSSSSTEQQQQQLPQKQETNHSKPHAIITSNNVFRAVMELPGIKANDLKLELHHGHVLIVTAYRHTNVSHEPSFRRRTRISRSMVIDGSNEQEVVDVKRLEANFSDGLLVIVAPRSSRVVVSKNSKPKKVVIPISTTTTNKIFEDDETIFTMELLPEESTPDMIVVERDDHGYLNVSVSRKSRDLDRCVMPPPDDRLYQYNDIFSSSISEESILTTPAASSRSIQQEVITSRRIFVEELKVNISNLQAKLILSTSPTENNRDRTQQQSERNGNNYHPTAIGRRTLVICEPKQHHGGTAAEKTETAGARSTAQTYATTRTSSKEMMVTDLTDESKKVAVPFTTRNHREFLDATETKFLS